MRLFAWEYRQDFRKNVFHLSHGIKNIEASYIFNIHIGEETFFNWFFWRFVNHFDSDRVKNLKCTLVCTGPICFYREETTKQILFTRSKFNFLRVCVWFDGPKFGFSLKNSSLKMLVTFLATFVTDTKIIFRYDFVALLIKW